MKLFFKTLAIALMMTAFACTPKEIEVSGITVEPETVSVVIGETAQLSAVIQPSTATNQTVTWSSSDQTVAVVTGDGLVAGLKEGSSVISATIGRISGSCTVTVTPQPIKLVQITLNPGELQLVEGDTATITVEFLPEDTTDKTVLWKSSDESIVKVADGVVTAIAEGNATITAASGGKQASCSVEVFPQYEAVDLGLSVKWASCNIGASVPEEVGGYYAWGEIETKEDYSWATYKWCSDGSDRNLTKYNTKAEYGYPTDGKTQLDPEDDVATVLRGPKWRIPTKEELEELRTQCNWQRASLNGVEGHRVTSKVDETKSIFIPYSGFYDGTSLQNSVYSYYRCSSLNPDDSRRAFQLYNTYYSNAPSVDNGANRQHGVPVRPVMEHGYVPVEAIALNTEKSRLVVGKTLTLTATVTPAWATNATVSWKSSDTGVATVADGVVTAVAVGTATITASADNKSVECAVTVEKQKTPEAVDLGLSVKWASFNVGGNAEEDFGDFFAWGETEPKEDYSWATYKWCDKGNSNSLTKYNTSPSYGMSPDGKTTLDPADDAATAVLGSGWRTPTYEEWEELNNQCKKVADASVNGVKGVRYIGKAGTAYENNAIFIPYGIGYMSGKKLEWANSAAVYWTSTLNSNPKEARTIYYNSSYGWWGIGNTNERVIGCFVRAVAK